MSRTYVIYRAYGGKNKRPRKKERSPNKKNTGRSNLRKKCLERQERELQEEAEYKSFVQMDHNDITRQMFILEKQADRRLEVLNYHMYDRERYKKVRNTKKPQQKEVSRERDGKIPY